MNKIKIYTIAAITALSASAVTAQDNYRPWLVGAGVSTVDFKVPERSVMKDWFGYPDMNIGFRLNAARYIKKGITAEAGFAYASIKKDQTYFPDVEETKRQNLLGVRCARSLSPQPPMGCASLARPLSTSGGRLCFSR